MDSYSEIVLKLAQYGINRRIAANIYQMYHGDSLKKLQTDPYAVINDVTGFGFKSADMLGKQLEIKDDDPRRINGAIYQVLIDA